MDNVDKELIEIRKDLCNLKKMKFLKKTKLLHTKRNEAINSLFKLNETANEMKIKELFLLSDWIRKQKDYVISSHIEPYVEFKILKKDFTTLVHFALSLNNNPFVQTFLPKDTLTLELIRLVVYKDGTGAGQDFIKRFIKLSNLLQVPILLYCEDNLISYYEKNLFKNLGRNYESRNFMVYFPFKV